MKKWLGYGLLAGVLVAYAILWLILKDAAGALVTLIALALTASLVGAIAAYVISNMPSWVRRFRGVSSDDHLGKLESSGAAEREHYEARRALMVEDLNTSCLMYVIEVAEGRLLCLYGQHYYEFEPIDDDPEVNQARSFPTTTFSLLRHKKKQEVLKVFPGAAVLEPTVCEPIVSYKGLDDLGFGLKDGELVSGVAFDAAERAIRANAKRPRRSR